MPEIASRRHLELVTPVIREALDEAARRSTTSTGRGHAGAGPDRRAARRAQAAKALAWGRGLPLVPVNHLHGHVASLYLEPDPFEPPFLCLLASGGHTLLLDVPEHGAFRRSGRRSTTRPARRSTRAPGCSGSVTRVAPRSTGSRARAIPRPSPSRSRACPGSTSRSRESRRRCCTRCAISATRPRSGGQISPRATSGRSCRRSSSGRSRPPSRPGRADRRRRRRRRELGASSGARGRHAATARALHRQRRDDRIRRPICRGGPAARLSCARCLCVGL